MDKIAIYPGTFDPMTNGHIDIVKRSLKIVDKLIISVADNVNKIALLSIDERKGIINNDIRKNNIEIINIEIKILTGLLTDFAKANHASCITLNVLFSPTGVSSSLGIQHVSVSPAPLEPYGFGIYCLRCRAIFRPYSTHQTLFDGLTVQKGRLLSTDVNVVKYMFLHETLLSC